MVRHDALVVVVSDFFGADALTEKYLVNIAEHNDVLGVLVLAAGVSMITRAQQPVHEIEAFIMFLISSVLISGAAIIDTMFYMLKKLSEQQPPR